MDIYLLKSKKNTIIIKIGIEDKKYGVQDVKELVIMIVLFNSNKNNNDDINMYGMHQRQGVGYAAMQYSPNPMMLPHGMGFPAHW